MSTVLLLIAMAAWLVFGTWRARRWHGIVPPDLDEEDGDEGKWAAIQSFTRLQAHANVTRWRRTIVTFGLVLIVVTWGVVEDERRDAQRAVDACQTRVLSREEVRAAIRAAVDEVARFAELDPPSREYVVARAEARVRTELPPPDC